MSLVYVGKGLFVKESVRSMLIHKLMKTLNLDVFHPQTRRFDAGTCRGFALYTALNGQI